MFEVVDNRSKTGMKLKQKDKYKRFATKTINVKTADKNNLRKEYIIIKMKRSYFIRQYYLYSPTP